MVGGDESEYKKSVSMVKNKTKQNSISNIEIIMNWRESFC